MLAEGVEDPAVVVTGILGCRGSISCRRPVACSMPFSEGEMDDDEEEEEEEEAGPAVRLDDEPDMESVSGRISAGAGTAIQILMCPWLVLRAK